MDFLDFHVFLWFLIDSHDFSWIFLIFHGFSWFLMDSHGFSCFPWFSWFCMDFHGFSWILMIFMESHDFAWIFMIFMIFWILSNRDDILQISHFQYTADSARKAMIINPNEGAPLHSNAATRKWYGIHISWNFLNFIELLWFFEKFVFSMHCGQCSKGYDNKPKRRGAPS